MAEYDDFDLNEFDTYEDDVFSRALSEELPYEREKSPRNIPIVTVFGAGISGLTAAHELVQRGFLVQVVESAVDEDDEYRANIGGLAKSQPARLKRTRRLHWNLYDDVQKQAYLKASPILENIDEESEFDVYVEVFREQLKKLISRVLLRSDEEELLLRLIDTSVFTGPINSLNSVTKFLKSVGGRGRIEAAIVKDSIRDQERLLNAYDQRVTDEAKNSFAFYGKVNGPYLSVLMEDDSDNEFVNLAKSVFDSLDYSCAREKIIFFISNNITSGQAAWRKFEKILRGMTQEEDRLFGIEYVLSETNKAKEIVSKRDLEIIRRLRDRPFQRVQKRFPISQRLTLPIGKVDFAGQVVRDIINAGVDDDEDRNNYNPAEQQDKIDLSLALTFSEEGRAVIKNENEEGKWSGFLNLFSKFDQNGDVEGVDSSLIDLLGNISDLHGEIQGQMGFFDEIYLNSFKIEGICKQIVEAIIQYTNDLMQDYEQLKLTHGKPQKLLNSWNFSREIYLLEIRAHCNLFSQDKLNERIAKMWAKLTKKWIVREISEAFKTVESLGQDNSSPEPDSLVDLLLKLKSDEPDQYDAFKKNQGFLDDHLECLGIAGRHEHHDIQSRIRTNYVEFKVVEHVVMGEHGFRFFPGFYRHIFDTMRRTPILDDKLRETGRTVFDQLVAPPPARMGLLAENDFYTLSRKQGSTAESLEQLNWMAGKLGFTLKDLMKYQTQILKFATSCPERRELYEDFSWMEFVDGESEYSSANPEAKLKKGSTKFSPAGEELLRELPQLLVAMSAEETDALTQAQTTLQLFLDDKSGEASTRDRMLNGPTSTAWLQHWRRFLTRQGVRFFTGKIDHVKFVGEELIPSVTGAGPGGLPLPENPFDIYIEQVPEGQAQPSPDFYVQSTPYQQATEQIWDVDKFDLEDDGNKKGFPKEFCLLVSQLPVLLKSIKRLSAIGKKKITWQIKHDTRADVHHDKKIEQMLTRYSKEALEKQKYCDLQLLYEDIDELKVLISEGAPKCNKHLLLRVVDRLKLDILSFEFSSSNAWGQRRAAARMMENAHIEGPKAQTFSRLNGDLRKLLQFDIAAARRDSEGRKRGGVLASSSPESVDRDPYGLPQPQFQFPLRDLSGIQYYFRELVRVGHGHFLLPNSPWGISGVAQLYMWRRRPSRTHGFIGQLSVDIGDFYQPYQAPGHFQALTAWQSSAQQIAENVWSQITETTGMEYRSTVSLPRYYQIDDGLIFGKETGTCSVNKNMLMINLPGQWKKRPGLRYLDKNKREVRYSISNRRWVMAGNFMASHTRLATMESANESGRLAANAIIKELGETRTPELYNGGGVYLGDFAEIWDPEKFELKELDMFKRLDKALFDKRVPHFIDILDIPRTINKIPDREDPSGTPLYNMSTLLEQAFLGPLKDWEVVGDFAKQAGLGNIDNLISKLRKTGDFSNKMLEMMIKVFDSGRSENE